MERRAQHVKSGLELIEEARQQGHEVIIGNQELPFASSAVEIAKSLIENQFTILIGETGSGKTTQLPQLIFSMGMIVDHTQPRRSAAHEAVKRIQEELSQALPQLHEKTTAVHTGEECTVVPQTQITVLTDGMFLATRYNSTNNALSNRREGIVIVVDEVHEANKNMEVIIGLLMKESKTNPDLRVVLVTATPNKDFLVSRIKEITGIEPNVVEVSGRTHPIEYIEKPESTSVEATLDLVKPGAGIMVFKPGLGEIKDAIKDIKKGLPIKLRDKVRFFIFHSSVSSRELSEACNYEQDPDSIKIVVGTNAMESSHSIIGIQYVVDDGVARVVSINKRGFEGLYVAPISQDRCIQRAGRAGRFCPGVAILTRADAKTPFISLADRPEHETPEFLRLDLKNEVLELAAIGIDLAAFETVYTIEDKLSIIRAKESLSILGALDDDGNITEIGLEMCKYPVRTAMKRTIVEAKKYSKDVQVMIAAMAGAVEAGGLPLYGRYASNDWKEISSESSSDLLRQLDLFIETRRFSAYQQSRIGINHKNVNKAQETYEKILYQLGIKDEDLLHPNELQREEIIRCIYAGHVEHIFQRVGRNTFRLLQDNTGGDTEDNTMYKLSDRSVVDPRHPRLVVGVPYIVERTRHGKKTAVPIIEAVTEVPSIDVLGGAAVHLARWSEGRVVWRGGRVFVRTEQKIRGMKTGVSNEKMGDATDVLDKSRELIKYVLENPGPAQLQLRTIKKELERLNHLSKDGVTRMTQKSLLEFIEMAVRNVSVPDAHHVDNELMLIIQQHNISLQTYIAEDEMWRVCSDAPGEIIVGSEVLPVEYRNGSAKVKHYNLALILSLERDIYLPDGRDVRFVYNKREWNAMDLKRELSAVA